MRKKIVKIFIVLILVFLGTAGLGIFYWKSRPKTHLPNNSIKINDVCEPGKTAYDILKQGRSVKLGKTKEGGDEVYSIFGLKIEARQKWVTYANGIKIGVEPWQYQCQGKEALMWTVSSR